MGGAARGSYLLTALPAWTGRPPPAPVATRLVVLLWISARIAHVAALSAEPVVSLIYFAALSTILPPRRGPVPRPALSAPTCPTSEGRL